MKNKIKSISEAFSMQPTHLYVTDPEHRSLNPEHDIQRIELKEIHSIPENFAAYVGYDFDGKAKFRYLSNSVNVHYF